MWLTVKKDMWSGCSMSIRYIYLFDAELSGSED